MNRVFLTGRVGRDPETKSFDKGSIVRFSLATSETYKNHEGEKVTDTSWHNIVARGKSVELVEKYVRKGMLLTVVGKIKYREYKDENDQKRSITEIQMFEMEFLSKSEGKAQSDDVEIDRASSHTDTPPDDDLPF